MKDYPQREIYVNGQYIQCQILNWEKGPPPKYLVCNPLAQNKFGMFLARQGLGTWMEADLRDVAKVLNEAPK